MRTLAPVNGNVELVPLDPPEEPLATPATALHKVVVVVVAVRAVVVVDVPDRLVVVTRSVVGLESIVVVVAAAPTLVVVVTAGKLVVVVPAGKLVVVVVAGKLVVVLVGGVTGHVGSVTRLVSKVTAPVSASNRPATLAPVSAVIELPAMTVPAILEPIPSVAELPICQYTLQASAPLISDSRHLTERFCPGNLVLWPTCPVRPYSALTCTPASIPSTPSVEFAPIVGTKVGMDRGRFVSRSSRRARPTDKLGR